MIYLATALYAEARPFLQALGLKSQETHCRFQLFTSDTHTLIVTGSGSLLAAIADTWMLAGQNRTAVADFFAQIGCAGSLSASVGGLYLCHKLTDAQTGHSVYPDMLYRSDFAEASLTTYPTVQRLEKEPLADPFLERSVARTTTVARTPAGGQIEAAPLPASIDRMTTLKAANVSASVRIPPELVDMEGYGGYQAASVFLPPHRIFTWKVVSDHGQTDALTATDISSLLVPQVDPILSWLGQVSSLDTEVPSFLGAGQQAKASDSKSELFPAFQLLAETFGYSSSQRQKLRQLLHYAALVGYTEERLLDGLSDAVCKPPTFRFHPAQRKKEGKRILYELEQRLLSP